MATATQPKTQVHAYVQAVIDGQIPAGRLVRLACERHQRDMADGGECGLWFDQNAADFAIEFYSYLPHSKGEWSGQMSGLQPWEQFIIGSLWGWKAPYAQCAICQGWQRIQNSDTESFDCPTCQLKGIADALGQPVQGVEQFRRFHMGYIEIPRKNGKSWLGAGAGLLLAFFDNEGGAEVYSAATKRDQAKIVWGEAKRMVERSPYLKKHVTVLTNNMHNAQTASKFEPLSADYNTMDGLNIHGVIIDELHAHATRDMWDVLRTATGARRQPMIFIITTAGFNRHSICWEQHDRGIKILERIIDDDARFVFISMAEAEDDWADPQTWVRVNPNLGITVKLDTLAKECEEAQQMPAQQNAFRRLRLCQWTEQSERWIDLALWDEGADSIDADGLKNRPCFGGLDLARVKDLSALALLFPPQDEGECWKLLMRFYCPEDSITERSRRDRVPYDVWAAQGFITPTPGNATDFRFIESDILKSAGMYNVREVAYDRMFADEMVQRLGEEGLTMVPIGQGFLSMAAPTAELSRMLLAGKLQHGGHPILHWNASNVAVKTDPAGNQKPDKEHSYERIDGIQALLNALARAMVQPDSGIWSWGAV